ncbi:3'-5' exonuclease [Pseudosulfitobacter pseudonitzschiae]|uniref:3'-5' exonuclease n=1 Tax=Pseudosulfitobacter pseudonitzschiae TaxID=1402135 RepID=UPI003B7D8E5B
MPETKTSEQQKKIAALVDKLSTSPSGMEMLRAALGENGLALMKIAAIEGFPEVTDPVRLSNAREGIILDVESTGLDTKKDEITELAMLRFTYDEQGIISLGDLYDEFNEPSIPIPEEVVQLTGITDEMVKGHKIDPREVSVFIADAGVVLAHNANFDRKMVEANLKGVGFEGKDWHCTAMQIDWIMRGKSGRSLEVLALSEGLVYGSHRADADIIATAFVLNSTDRNGISAFAEMLEKGSTPSIMVIAKDTPFQFSKASPMFDPANPKAPCGDVLKKRGYRWSPDGSDIFDAASKGWHTEIFGDEESKKSEADFLRDFYGREVSIPSFRVDARDRYSDRRPGDVVLFRTSEVGSLKEAAAQVELVRQPSLDF